MPDDATRNLAAAFDAICRGTHGDPFGVLGCHPVEGGDRVVRAFLPEAVRAWVVAGAAGTPGDGSGPEGEVTPAGAPVEMARRHPDGLFTARLPAAFGQTYRLRVETASGTAEIDDPYRFGPLLTESDAYYLAEGTHRRLYDVLGAHPRHIDGVDGVAFAVWAPNARRVSVVGGFNNWDGRRHPMRKRAECGVWELFVPGLAAGAVYKYELLGPDGSLLPLKADPMMFRSEIRPANGSVVAGLPAQDWTDAEWLARRQAAADRSAPIAIYEVHLGSWMRGDGNRFLTYDELADRLVPYLQEMGFTHVELLPVTEHPFDGSWGYQPTGLYAPTSRHGDPAGFARLVDRCHAAGIGVLLDWVPGHFPTDAHALGRFDGTALYEHDDPRRGYHLDWNTFIYNHGRREVSNFLLANALYWAEQFHLDGLRVDAVASMLYLDYSRPADQWIPNRYGGRENLESMEFLQTMNSWFYGAQDGVMTVAEESTAWPGVSRPVYAGGLGFGYKWNMGWMHDSLEYIQKDPIHRRYHHHDLTFSMVYAYSENYVLPLSHDEVVHGKGSLLGKMPGDSWQQFANLRAYYGFMYGHPGKKLLFMGCEFGQRREWSEAQSLDWHLIDDDRHRGVQQLVRDLNHLYGGCAALHALDCDPAGFEWVEDHDADNNVIAFLRKGSEGTSPMLVICHFAPVVRHAYRVGVPVAGVWQERLNTDAAVYGGSNVGNGGAIRTEPAAWHGRDQSLALTLPPLATLFLEPVQGGA